MGVVGVLVVVACAVLVMWGLSKLPARLRATRRLGKKNRKRDSPIAHTARPL